MTAVAVQLDETTERLEAEACTLAAQIAAATCRFLLVVAELDRREAWREWGCQSMAHWLSWMCALALPTAREHVRVSRAIEELPHIAEAFADGRLSFSKVRALVRIAKPEREAEFIELAAVTTASQLEKIAGAYVATTRDSFTSQVFRRGVRVMRESDGSYTFRVRMTADAGATLVAALDAAAADVPDDDASADASLDPLGARRADALELLARGYLEPEAQRAPRTRVVLEGNVDALADPTAGEPLRAASCDAELELDAGRRRRTVPPALRRTIERRDERRCRFPGCGNELYLHAHHVVHWAHGGGTDADNLILLCTFHHRLIHTSGWRVRGRVFIDPRGRELSECVEPPVPPVLRIAPSINASTISTANGGRMDLDHAITALVSREGRPPSPN